MGRQARAAGSRFERRIATDLRRWLGDEWEITRNQTDRQKGQDGVSFGEFTIRGPYTFPFCIECKTRGDFQEYQLWAPGQTKAFRGHWRQAMSQAIGADLNPMLICKSGSSPRPPLAVMGVPDARWAESIRTRMEIVVSGKTLVVFSWNDLLCVSPGMMFEEMNSSWSTLAEIPPAPLKVV